MTDIDLDDVVRLAVSAKVWSCVQDLADAVLALADCVRKLEMEIKDVAADAPHGEGVEQK